MLSNKTEIQKHLVKKYSKHWIRMLLCFLSPIISFGLFMGVMVIVEYFTQNSPYQSTILISSFLVYIPFWSICIPRAAQYIGTVVPLKNTVAADAQTIHQTLAQLNELTLPFRLVQKENKKDDYFVIQNDGGGSIGTFSKHTTMQDFSETFRFRVDEKNHRILYQRSSKGTVTRSEGGAYSSSRNWSISIDFIGYELGLGSGLKYKDRKFYISTKLRNNDIRKLLNPMVEMCIDHGWTWRPVMFLF